MNFLYILKNNIIDSSQVFFDTNSLPELMQGMAGAIITIQISFAVGILIESYQRRGKANGALDLRVFLDEVWNFKLMLVATLVAFISPFFLVYENLVSDSIFFSIWIVSLVILTLTLIRLYKGVKNTSNEFKLKYFSKKRDKVDTQESWRSLWSGKSDDRFEDEDYFEHFSSDIDTYLSSDNQEDVRFAGRLLNDFHDFIDNRDSVFLLSFDNCFPKILEWHYLIWEKQYSTFAKENMDKIDRTSYFEIDYIVDNIIHKITNEALSTNRARSSSYFIHLENHFKKYSKEEVEGKKHNYIYLESVPIYQDIFEKIPESNESHDIWSRYFPQEWKITEKNYKKYTESRVFLRNFLDWVQSRNWGKKEEGWDKVLDNISKELFPSTEPRIWSRIITFVFSAWSDSRMKNIVEQDIKFGYIGQSVSGSGEEDISKKLHDLTEEKEESSIKLALFLFENVFSKGSVEQWILDLESMEYSEDTKYYSEKLTWLEILNKMLILISKSN